MQSANFFKPSDYQKVLFTALIAGCTLCVIAFCIWSLDRGFDITDEAYYVSQSIHPEAVTLYISAQQWITSALWIVTGSLPAFRSAGLGILMLSGSLLAYGSTASFAKNEPEAVPHAATKPVVFCAAIVTSLLYAATINLSPSYNLLASAGAYAAAGLVILAVDTKSTWQRCALTLLSGFALSVEFICKPSSGVASGFLLVLFLSFGPGSFAKRALASLMLFAGFTLSTGSIAFSHTTLDAGQASLTGGFELFRLVQTEPIRLRLLRYFVEFASYSGDAMRTFLVPIVLTIFYKFKRSKLICSAIILSAGYSLVAGGALTGGSDRYPTQIESAFVLTALGLIISYSIWTKTPSRLIVIILLLLLPYSVAIGTGNSLFVQIIVSLAPWGVMWALLVGVEMEHSLDRALMRTLFAFFIITISSQIISSGFRSPYHLAQPLWQQSTKTSIKGLGEVRLDPLTKAFVTQLDLARNKCRLVQDQPFLGLYNIPGVPIVLGAIPIATPWLNNVIQAEFILNRLGHNDSLDNLLIGISLNADGTYPPLPARLAGFPKGYKFCGKAVYPFLNQNIEVWASNQIPK